MTSEEKLREEEFRKVCDSCTTPEFLVASIGKLTAQYLRIMKVHKVLSPKERKKIANAGRPMGWVFKIFLRMRKTVFKELTRDRMVGKSPYFIAGKFIGISENLSYGLKDLCRDQSEIDLFEKTFGCTPDSLGQALDALVKRHEDHLEVERNNAKKDQQKPKEKSPTPAQLADFYAGRSAGVKGVFKEGVKMTYDRGPAEVYLSLLLYSKVVRNAPNINALYDFLGKGLTDSLPKTPTALEKICRRVGIPLALKTEPRKIAGHNKTECPGNKI